MEVSARDIRKIQQVISWIRKFKITGPYVTGTNSPDGGASYYIGAPKREAAARQAPGVRRVKVTSPPTTALPRVALVRQWDGTAMSGDVFPVECFESLATSQVVNVYHPAGGTAQTYSSAPVTWRQIEIPARGVPLVVVLASDGGAGSPVSYTYTVTAPGSGVVLASAATPHRRIYKNGASWVGNVPVAATRGLGYFTVEDDVFVLLEAYESYQMNVGCA